VLIVTLVEHVNFDKVRPLLPRVAEGQVEK
jgi:hypothetical protein